MFTSLDLATHFGFRVLNGDLNDLRHPVTIAELDRPGVELLGLFRFHQNGRIMLIGNKEIDLIQDSDPDFVYQNCLRICSPECPCIIITQGHSCPEAILKAARQNHCPVFSSDEDTSRLSSDLYVYLTEALAPKTSLHACLIEIYGIGVLIMGESGIGKSEISLDLIKKGHRLIADDRVDVRNIRGRLIGTCPEPIYGMMEVRGIGIIDVPKMFGVNSLSKSEQIRFIINLVSFNPNEPVERIGMKTDVYTILDEEIPMVKLPVSAARSMSDIIETAVTNYKLKDDGYDTGYEFQRRLAEIRERRERERTEAYVPPKKEEENKE